jgi:hypothetical protein
VSELLSHICFSNRAFRWTKRLFFHRVVLCLIGVPLAIGLPLALIGVAIENDRLTANGFGLALPFVVWTGALAAVGFVLAIPRFLVLGVAIAAAFFGLAGVNRRIVEWCEKYEKGDARAEPA